MKYKTEKHNNEALNGLVSRLKRRDGSVKPRQAIPIIIIRLFEALNVFRLSDHLGCFFLEPSVYMVGLLGSAPVVTLSLLRATLMTLFEDAFICIAQ